MTDLRDPPSGAFAITPSDTALLPMPVVGIWYGGTAAGTVQVTMAGPAVQGTGGKVELQNIQPGTYLALRAVQVWSTGTTAGTNLIGFVQ